MADCGLCPKSFSDVKKVCEHFETDHLGDIKNESNDSGIYGVIEMELDEDFFSKSIFREDFFAKNNVDDGDSKKHKRQSSSSDSSSDSGDYFEEQEYGGKFEFENNEKDKLFANKRKRKSSSSDSGREDQFEEQENHVKNQQQRNKARIGKKRLPYLQFDLNEDAELIAEKMVEGVNIPGQ